MLPKLYFYCSRVIHTGTSQGISATIYESSSSENLIYCQEISENFKEGGGRGGGGELGEGKRYFHPRRRF